jgi:hypothetical protein
MGVAYIGFAIITHMEIIAIIAILPAILNSFIFLSSTKKIVEHRELKGKAVCLTDGKLHANKEKAAVSIIRLILARKPLTERELGRAIYRMMIFSGILAVWSAMLFSFNEVAHSTDPSVYFIPGTAIVLISAFFIFRNNHNELYIMIFFTWVAIMLLTTYGIVDISEYTQNSIVQVLLTLPMLAIFVGFLIVMKRKLLKPLYDEFKPEYHSGSHP